MKLLHLNGTTIDLEQMEVVHYTTGRIRLRSGQLKQNDQMAKSVLKSVSGFDFIKGCKVNTTTGSILLIFEPPDEKQIQDWVAQISSSGLLPDGMKPEDVFMYLSHSNNESKSLSDEIRAYFGGLNSHLKKSTGGVLGLNEAFPLFLFFLGFRRLLTTDRLAFPEWYTYLWFAFTAYFVLNPHPGETEGDKPGN